MLMLTRKTDYALIALTHLAQESSCCSSAREIAGQYGVPLPLLMNILKLLTQRGLARSSRGPRGGYALARPAEQITLHDVICAVEGPVQLVQCVESHGVESGVSGAGTGPGECELVACCPVRSPIHRVQERLVGFLTGVTLADVAGNNVCCGKPVPIAGETEYEVVHLSR